MENINEERELNMTGNFPSFLAFGEQEIMKNLVTWRRDNVDPKDTWVGLTFHQHSS